jgi:muramoyltetrapeptide carboxypeptidase
MFNFKPMSKTISSIVPAPLKQGDSIAVVATARFVDIKVLAFAEQLFNSWGLKPKRGVNLLNQDFNFAGTDSERKKDLQWAFDDRSIKAIFCFRGGYGSVRILEGLENSNLKKGLKWIIGFSDVTALHNYMNSQCSTASLHATMPINYKENTTNALHSLKEFLFNKKINYSFEANSNNKLGNCVAPIVGGNLAILQSLSGTKYDISTKGKILFLEDVDEYLYNIDRMLWTLKLSGKLAHLSGIIVGKFTGVKDNETPFGLSVDEMILEKVEEYNYPVCFNFPAGHFDDNCALPFGVNIQFSVEKEKVRISV